MSRSAAAVRDDRFSSLHNIDFKRFFRYLFWSFTISRTSVQISRTRHSQRRKRVGYFSSLYSSAVRRNVVCGRYAFRSERIAASVSVWSMANLTHNRSISRRAWSEQIIEKRLPTSAAISAVNVDTFPNIDDGIVFRTRRQSRQTFFPLSSRSARTFRCGFSDVFGTLFARFSDVRVKHGPLWIHAVPSPSFRSRTRVALVSGIINIIITGRFRAKTRTVSLPPPPLISDRFRKIRLSASIFNFHDRVAPYNSAPCEPSNTMFECRHARYLNILCRKPVRRTLSKCILKCEPAPVSVRIIPAPVSVVIFFFLLLFYFIFY